MTMRTAAAPAGGGVAQTSVASATKKMRRVLILICLHQHEFLRDRAVASIHIQGRTDVLEAAADVEAETVNADELIAIAVVRDRQC